MNRRQPSARAAIRIASRDDLILSLLACAAILAALSTCLVAIL